MRRTKAHVHAGVFALDIQFSAGFAPAPARSLARRPEQKEVRTSGRRENKQISAKTGFVKF